MGLWRITDTQPRSLLDKITFVGLCRLSWLRGCTASVIILETSRNNFLEEALRHLMKIMDPTSRSAQGLALLHGFFSGERTSAPDDLPLFDKNVEKWANNLGTEWCKLVVIDLMVFRQARTEEQADPALVKKLYKSSEEPRQDWNGILQNMDLRGHESQVRHVFIFEVN